MLAVGPEQEDAQALFNKVAVQTALLAGLFQLGMRLLRLHFLVSMPCDRRNQTEIVRGIHWCVVTVTR